MTNSPAILRVAVLATTVLSWVSDETNAFSIVPTTTNSFPLLVPPTRLQRTVSLRESPRDESSSVETVQVVDVEAAMEALEEQGLALDDEEDEEEEETDDQPLIQVVVQNDVSDAELLEEYTREELVSEVEEVILEGIGTQREEAKSDLESPQTTKKKTLAGDIRGKFVKGGSTISITEEHTTKEAAVSASLYMNPATERIASNLIISWEPEVAEILDQLVRVSNPDRPLMVGIVGIPGSGKSTSCEIIATLLGGSNADERAIVMPMDGFHLPLQTLAEHPNAADLIYRRGAPDTFDPNALAKALGQIAHGDEAVVAVPGFDHAMGDPVPDQHIFDRNKHKIVLCEGIYLLHNDDGWNDIKSFFDWTIYIDVDLDACIERLKERNKCIPGYTPEEIEARCDIVDRKNAELSRDSARKYASQIVQSGAS